MSNPQELIDMLEAGTRDEVVGAAVRWYAAWTSRRVVEAADGAIGLDEPDSEQVDRIDRFWAVELEAAESLAEKVELALRCRP